MLFKIARIGTSPVIAYAADELKRCLEIMDPSLEIIPLRYDSFRKDVKNAVFVGTDPALDACLPDVPDRELDDAIAIDVSRGSGYITGANDRAVLIAVFRYLRELGASWVRAGDGEYLPQTDVMSRCVKLAEKPSCRHRGVCIEGADSVSDVMAMIDWLPRVGMNGYFNQFHLPATFYERWYGPHLEKTDPGASLDLADIDGIRSATVAEIKKRGLLYHAAGHGWTCEPFGISGTGWDAAREHYVPQESKKYLALVGGKRELWGNIPLNTNLCYSNPEVRETISRAVADYCVKQPEIDYVQVWLADGMNNHCECPECAKKRPSDWYVDILNGIDAEMTKRGVKAKVVFLMYCDLYWPPVTSKLNNPDRFVLMFAPITRTYSKSLSEAGDFDEERLPDYVRNRCVMPRSVEENLARLRQWERFFGGDGFDFDYHYMWDQHRDLAHMSMNKVLFDDMKALKKLGLNGMMSCQNQRVWLPSGFGMTAMAAALWDGDADYDGIADRYFGDAFGRDGRKVRDYLEQLSLLMRPEYMRMETEKVSPEAAASFEAAARHIKAFSPVMAENLALPLPEAQKKSWKYLEFHARLVSMLIPAVKARAEGRDEDAKTLFSAFTDFARASEPDIAPALDVFELVGTLRRMF